MQSVGITQESINSGLGDPMGQAEIQLAKAIALKVEADVLAAALTGTQAYDGSASVIKYAGIVDAIDVLDEEEITDKVMFVNPSRSPLCARMLTSCLLTSTRKVLRFLVKSA